MLAILSARPAWHLHCMWFCLLSSLLIEVWSLRSPILGSCPLNPCETGKGHFYSLFRPWLLFILAVCAVPAVLTSSLHLGRAHGACQEHL